MGSNASSVAKDSAKPGSSWWESESMDPNGEDHPPVRIFVVGDYPEDSQTQKENLFKLAAKVEEEGFIARKAVCECLNTETYPKESAKVAERRCAAARRKAKRRASFVEAEHHRTTADKLSTAAKLTARRAKNLDHSLQWAETDAKSALLLATKTFRDLDRTEANPIDQNAFEHLECAKDNAIRGTATLKEDEYLVLKAMQRCWESHLTPSEEYALQEGRDGDLTTPINHRDQTYNGPSKWISMTLAVIFGIAGCIMIILSTTLSIDGSSFIAMLTTGAAFTLWSLNYFISKITQQIIAKRKLAYIHRRTAMLKFIDERLADLTHFFTTKDMPIPSDEDEEKNPITRSPR